MADKKAELIRRESVVGLKHCCFIFSHDGPFFRIYSADRKTFTDYDIARELTPFITFDLEEDSELKTYKMPDGSLKRILDFPEQALTDQEIGYLRPGEVWESENR